MAVIGFNVGPREDLNGVVEVIPVIDGEELTAMVHSFERTNGMSEADNYGGLIPEHFRFGPMSRHFLAAEGAFVNGDGKVPVLGCECGEWGCWPLLASITTTDNEVIWSNLEQPYRPEREYQALEPLRFDRRQYEAALKQLERQLE